MASTQLRRHGSFALTLMLLVAGGCRPQNPAAVQRISVSGSEVTSIDSASQVTAEEIESKTFNKGAKPRVAVEVFLGAIEIVASDDEAIHATLTKRAGGKTQAEAEAAGACFT